MDGMVVPCSSRVVWACFLGGIDGYVSADDTTGSIVHGMGVSDGWKPPVRDSMAKWSDYWTLRLYVSLIVTLYHVGETESALHSPLGSHLSEKASE